MVLDALTRMCAKIQEQIKAENERAVGSAPRSRKKAPVKEANGKVALGAGAGVAGVKELIDYIFSQADMDQSFRGLLELPIIDGGIVAILTASATWLATKKR